jgi:hypothetical protein
MRNVLRAQMMPVVVRRSGSAPRKGHWGMSAHQRLQLAAVDIACRLLAPANLSRT